MAVAAMAAAAVEATDLLMAEVAVRVAARGVGQSQCQARRLCIAYRCLPSPEVTSAQIVDLKVPLAEKILQVLGHRKANQQHHKDRYIPRARAQYLATTGRRPGLYAVGASSRDPHPRSRHSSLRAAYSAVPSLTRCGAMRRCDACSARWDCVLRFRAVGRESS